MSGLLNVYRSFLNLPLSLSVKSRAIPTDPITELELNLEQPIVYVLPYTSQTDLMILRKNCIALNLPDPLQENVIARQSLPRFVFLDEGRRFFKSKGAKSETESIFYRYLDLHRENADLDVQLVPVSVLWGRAPGKEDARHLQVLTSFQRFMSMIWFGRDNFVRFSQAVSLRYMVTEHGADEKIAQKVARVAKIHFSKLRYSAMGPRLPNREAMFNKILNSEVIQAAIAEEAKKSSPEKARKEAEKIIHEIAADVKHESLRVADRVLSWLWNKLYQGINVQNGDRVRKLALEGHEIVYVPCHRSHMDYLLLSYLLYHQGLVPPHIAAGINLNFWPAGPIFRSWGAFFIRRTFKGNRLYSTIFREYLAELFYRGYSVEYFIEGGRSRTGRLLTPKTGMMSMTLQALQRGLNRPLSIVPVYIGYEHVLEVETYAKELRGAEKEKENVGLVLRVIRKLRNLGKGFVNFGEPITVNNYLNEHFPEWREESEDNRAWLNKSTDKLATQIMNNINDAAAVNAMNLIGTILLSTEQRALGKEQLIAQLDNLMELLKNVNYAKDVILPNESAEEMIAHVLSLDKVGILEEQDEVGSVIRLERNAAMLMSYYRNNVFHLFVLPSLVAKFILQYRTTDIETLCSEIEKIFPFIRRELFISLKDEDVNDYLHKIIEQLVAQSLIAKDGDSISIRRRHFANLKILADASSSILQRYFITLRILQYTPDASRSQLEKGSHSVAKRLSVLHGIRAPELIDNGLFATFVMSLREENFFLEDGLADIDKVKSLRDTIEGLLNRDVLITIQDAMDNEP